MLKAKGRSFSSIFTLILYTNDATGHDITHVKAIAIFATKEKLSSCEAPKNGEVFPPCIPQKIVIVCNHWALFAHTHDFLFNPKVTHHLQWFSFG